MPEPTASAPESERASVTSSEERALHRPLPSVGIPLLRDEVRASRARRIGLGVVVAALGIGGLGFVVIGPWLANAPDEVETPPAATDEAIAEDAEALEAAAELAPVEAEEAEAPPEVAPIVEQPLPDDGARTIARFGQAAGFRPGLVAAGLSGAEADAVIVALDGVMDFRRCRPDHTIVIDRAADGSLARFEYRASTTQIYRAERTDEGVLHGSQVEVPIERVRIRRGGTIRASLGSALERAGLGRTLVGTFVEVFERHVNFNTDTREGDTFRIIVDEERIGGELLRYGTVHAIDVRGSRLGEHRAYWYAPRENSADFYDETGRALHGGWLRTPLRYDHISSPFDPRRRHPILRRIVPHNGVDYAAGTGTPVSAAADGVITFIGPRGANGNLVSLRHDNGYESHYAHLSRFASGLERNDRVSQRQVIGYVGSTGRSTGPHLHFGLKRNGRFVDPQAELNGPGRMMPAAFLTRYRRHVRELERELAAIPVATAPVAEVEDDEPRETPPAEPID